MSDSSQAYTVYAGDPYSPVGTILGPGSTSLRLTEREHQVATMVSMGYSYKRINHSLGVSNAGRVVSDIAKRIPGAGNPRQKVSAWMWTYATSAQDAGT